MSFQANAFQNDAFQVEGVIPVTAGHGSFYPFKHHDRKRPSRKDRERQLDAALAKAFEPKRGPKRIVEPWLIEPVPVPEVLPTPEFNPVISGLSNYVVDLQRQLAQRKFELSQMEADDELLLLSL
jgi:hypothetical protein